MIITITPGHSEYDREDVVKEARIEIPDDATVDAAVSACAKLLFTVGFLPVSISKTLNTELAYEIFGPQDEGGWRPEGHAFAEEVECASPESSRSRCQ